MRDWGRESQLPAPRHYSGFVLAVHHNNDRVDVQVFGQHVALVTVPFLPGLELKRGYRVSVTVSGHDCCVTAVTGFLTEEQITGALALAQHENRRAAEVHAAREQERKAGKEREVKRRALGRVQVCIQDAVEAIREARDATGAAEEFLPAADVDFRWPMNDALMRFENLERVAAAWTAEGADDV